MELLPRSRTEETYHNVVEMMDDAERQLQKERVLLLLE